ncbi:MAG: hypothetical protein JNL72_05995 [Flavipsychrobacter sp.]|nr:hypothetical protein [Flavipsychrobacter sp.]
MECQKQQENSTARETKILASELTNPSPAFREEERQEDEQRRRWLIFEAQRTGMVEGLQKPEP